MTGAAPAADTAAASGDGGDLAIRVEGLRKAYAGREILAGVSFDVRRGELFALLGPNGAGKTTTVEILEGYRRPDGGTARVLGLDPGRDARRLQPRIGLMLQEGGIDNRTTPREVLRLYARFYRDPEDPDRLLEAVDLGAVAADALSAPVGRREAAPRAGPRAARASRAARPRRADRRHGPGRQAGDAGADRVPSGRRARRSCSPRTSWATSSASPIASRCSTGGGWWRAARRAS